MEWRGRAISSDSVTAPALAAEYVTFALAVDPIRATAVGVHDHGDTLGEIDADAIADQEARREAFLVACEGLPSPEPGTTEWLDRETLLIELRTAVYADRHTRVWARAPYWYPERLGAALMPLIMRNFAPLDERGALVGARLSEIPAYLDAARRNLAKGGVPKEWAEMGVVAATGLRDFVAGAVRSFVETLPRSLADELVRPVDEAARAVDEYRRFAVELVERGDGDWSAGREAVSFLLAELHRMEYDADGLAALGRARVVEDAQRLEAFAAIRDPHRRWLEQLSAVKDRHPQPRDFVKTYGDEMARSREHTLAVPLITIPEGEQCVMGWVPAYLAASLPIAVVHMSPSFEPGLRSDWLITPSDAASSPERKLEQMRDNCFAFAESIAGHETYPGHHLQRVHHKLATADSPIRRLFTSPSFVEGWGLYVEDIQDETGFLDQPDVQLFRLRNSLWRSVRVVVDSGLHTGTLAFDDAVGLLEREAGLDRHMATGEVRRYIRHDNPTYPSSYLLGREAIHALRAKWTAENDGRYEHRPFHDWLLSFGSVPVALVEQMLNPATRSVPQPLKSSN